MNIKIPSNATTQSIQSTHVPPRGATHFRFITPKKRPIIDKIKNLDTLAGCSGKLEYGSVEFEGRGRYAKIKSFAVLSIANNPGPEPALPSPELAAAPETTRPAQRSSKGRKNKVLGFSACAVAKALGAAGVKHEEADRIFRAHGIEMPKASLCVQLGFGRNQETWEKRGKPAPLTTDQIADLRREVAA